MLVNDCMFLVAFEIYFKKLTVETCLCNVAWVYSVVYLAH